MDLDRIDHLQTGAFWKHIGMRVYSIDTEHAVVRLDIRPGILQIYGNVHGGVLASLIDSASSVLLHAVLSKNERPVTSQMSLYYLQAARGEYLEAVAVMVKRGRYLAVCRADVFDDQGEHVAYGTGEFYIKRHIPNTEGYDE